MGCGTSSLSAADLTRNGVSPSCVVLPRGPWDTVLAFLVQRFPGVTPAEWLQRLQAGDVQDAQGTVLATDTAYTPGRRLYYYRALAQEIPIPFEAELLYRDDDLLVLDKPHYLPVLPSGKYLQETLLVRLKKHWGLHDLVPIHRIDRDTAGLVMFSARAHTRDAYHALFRQRQVDKTYHAVAPWNPELSWPQQRASRIGAGAHFMQQAEVAGPPNSLTRIRPLHAGTTLALYELLPVTGHRHQLRVHMAALGLPIVNDGIYATLTPEGPHAYDRPLQLLAQRLSFLDPLSGERRTFESRRRLSLQDCLSP